jgi:hypothetical protein
VARRKEYVHTVQGKEEENIRNREVKGEEEG